MLFSFFAVLLARQQTPLPGTDATCRHDLFVVRNVSNVSCATSRSSMSSASDAAAAACGDVDAQLRTLQPAPPLVLPLQRPRIALCFYSLTRSLRRTLPSIARNVIQPLLRSTAQLEVFVHTFNVSVSACTGCDSTAPAAPIDWRSDVAALQRALPASGVPLHVQVDDQASFIRRLGRDFTHSFQTTWHADGTAHGTAQFYLAALHSLKRVTAMWHAAGPWHVVYSLRPDLVYLDPLPMPRSFLEEYSGGAAGGALPASALCVPPRLFKRGKWADDKFAIGEPVGALLPPTNPRLARGSALPSYRQLASTAGLPSYNPTAATYRVDAHRLTAQAD